MLKIIYIAFDSPFNAKIEKKTPEIFNNKKI